MALRGTPGTLLSVLALAKPMRQEQARTLDIRRQKSLPPPCTTPAQGGQGRCPSTSTSMTWPVRAAPPLLPAACWCHRCPHSSPRIYHRVLGPASTEFRFPSLKPLQLEYYIQGPWRPTSLAVLGAMMRSPSPNDLAMISTGDANAAALRPDPLAAPLPGASLSLLVAAAANKPPPAAAVLASRARVTTAVTCGGGRWAVVSQGPTHGAVWLVAHSAIVVMTRTWCYRCMDVD